MLKAKSRCLTDDFSIDHNWRKKLPGEYQAYLKNIEQLSARQIAMIKQASAAEVNAMFQKSAIQQPEAFSSQAEAENTAFIITIIGKAVAKVADCGINRIISTNVGETLFKETVQEFPLQWTLLKLAGIDCQKMQRQTETAQRNCLIGALTNFKLKALAMIRQEYARQYRAFAFDEANADSQIAS
jgi:hypothetical protein